MHEPAPQIVARALPAAAARRCPACGGALALDHDTAQRDERELAQLVFAPETRARRAQLEGVPWHCAGCTTDWRGYVHVRYAPAGAGAYLSGMALTGVAAYLGVRGGGPGAVAALAIAGLVVCVAAAVREAPRRRRETLIEQLPDGAPGSTVAGPARVDPPGMLQVARAVALTALAGGLAGVAVGLLPDGAWTLLDLL